VRIRFATAGDVFTAFPTLSDDVLAKPSEEEPLLFLKRLMASETPEDALTFFAYLAPKREAVWWGCRCVRALDAARVGDPLLAAERWVAEPEEVNRVAALKLANDGVSALPATWAAYGAGWSGGNIGVGGVSVLAAPHLTAKAVRACALIAVSSAPARERASRLQVAYEAAVEVAKADLEAQFG
jgi:hypothetical protein